MELTSLPNLRRPTGNLLSTRLPAIGHGVNVDGLMGAGVAKAIRALYPQVFLPYSTACATKVLIPGSMLPVKVTEDRWIFNLASQDRPGPHARLEWLQDSLDATFAFCEEEKISGFALPRIGAGIGGLEWDDVHEMIWTGAKNHPNVRVEVWSL